MPFKTFCRKFASFTICTFPYVTLTSTKILSGKSLDKYHACLVKVYWEGELQQKAAMRS